MVVDATLGAALERVSERAREALAAFVPGAIATSDETARAPEPPAMLDPLAAAAPPETYFVFEEARGRGARRYGTDGAFRLDGTTLCDRDGAAVLGSAQDQAPLEPLRVDAVDVALGRVRRLHLEADGAIAYERDAYDPRSGALRPQRVVVGRLALARFPAGTRLQPTDIRHGEPPAGVQPVLGHPGEGGFARLRLERRAAPAIDLDRSLDRLREAYLALDALRAGVGVRAACEKTAMDLVK